MENPAANRQWLLLDGIKEARAAWVFTKACYATTKKKYKNRAGLFLIILH